jgi:hypothetical protein
LGIERKRAGFVRLLPPASVTRSGTTLPLLTRSERCSELEQPVDYLKCVFSAFYRGGHLFRWVQQRVVPRARGEFPVPVPVAPCPALGVIIRTSKRRASIPFGRTQRGLGYEVARDATDYRGEGRCIYVFRTGSVAASQRWFAGTAVAVTRVTFCDHAAGGWGYDLSRSLHGRASLGITRSPSAILCLCFQAVMHPLEHWPWALMPGKSKGDGSP